MPYNWNKNTVGVRNQIIHSEGFAIKNAYSEGFEDLLGSQDLLQRVLVLKLGVRVVDRVPMVLHSHASKLLLSSAISREIYRRSGNFRS